MATGTKARGASTTDEPTAIGGFAVEKIDKLDEPMRGRGFTQETLDVRAELEASLVDREGRSFNVGTDSTQEQRETLARVIRSAGKMTGRDEIKVSIRFASSTGRLMWGPKEVMDELSKKGKGESTD